MCWIIDFRVIAWLVAAVVVLVLLFRFIGWLLGLSDTRKEAERTSELMDEISRELRKDQQPPDKPE